MLNLTLLDFDTQICSTSGAAVVDFLDVVSIPQTVHHYLPQTHHFNQLISCHDSVFVYLFSMVIVINAFIGY